MTSIQDPSKTIFPFSANPEEALTFYDKFRDNFKQAQGKDFEAAKIDPTFFKIFGNSHFLTLFLTNHPQLALTYQNEAHRHSEKPFAVMQTELNTHTHSATDLTALVHALKKYKYQEFFRLTLRELALENQDEIYRELSHLCYALVQKLMEALIDDVCQRHSLATERLCDSAIIAMGKLGGLELNYSSDIDLIGLYDFEADHGGCTNHELYTKVFSRLGQILQGFDENGFLYRVDWDLRPEGKTGTLANSLAAMETYYEAFGEEWERQAFIKANVMYQRDKVGNTFLDMMTPFVYRKYLDKKTIERISDMKSRIVGEWKKKRIDGINIKLGNGGIRDIEFIAQGLQLLHAGKNLDLRLRNTLQTLTVLNQFKLLDDNTAQLLKESYCFLRRVESTLQMENEQQTHVVKNNPAERLRLARRMGLTQNDAEALDAFNEHLDKTLQLVHQTFQRFYEG